MSAFATALPLTLNQTPLARLHTANHSSSSTPITSEPRTKERQFFGGCIRSFVNVRPKRRLLASLSTAGGSSRAHAAPSPAPAAVESPPVARTVAQGSSEPNAPITPDPSAHEAAASGDRTEDKAATAFVYRLVDAFSASPPKEQQMRFRNVMDQAREQQVDVSMVVTRTLGRLRAANQGRGMRALAQQAAESGVSLGATSIQKLIESSVAAKDYKGASYWLAVFCRDTGLVPRLELVNSVLELLIAKDKAASATFVLEGLYDRGLKRDPSTFEAMAGAYIARGRHGEALACGREMMAASAALPTRNARRAPVRFNKLLHRLVAAGAREEAAALFADMSAPSCHVRPDVATYDAMVRGAVDAGDPAAAVAFAAQARAAGIAFDTVRLNAVARELLARGEIDAADRLVAAMAARPEVGTTPVTWLQLANALVEAGRYDEAAATFLKARPKVLAAAAGGDGRELAALYNVAIKAAAAQRLFNKVASLLEEMRGDGARPGEAAYGVWMDALVDEGRLSEAIGVFQQARAALPEGSSEAGLWNLVLKGFLRLGQTEDGRRWLETMREAGVEPDVRSFSSVLAAMLADGRFPDARAVLDEAAAAGVADRRLYGSLLTGLVRRREYAAAWELLEAMEAPSSPVRPDRGIYHTLLAPLCASGRLRPARDLFYRAAEHGVALDRASYAAMIRALRKAGRADAAAEWEGRMKRAPEPEGQGRRPGAQGAPQHRRPTSPAARVPSNSPSLRRGARSPRPRPAAPAN